MFVAIGGVKIDSQGVHVAIRLTVIDRWKFNMEVKNGGCWKIYSILKLHVEKSPVFFELQAITDCDNVCFTAHYEMIIDDILEDILVENRYTSC